MPAQFTLHAKVPLLRVRNYEMPRHFQHKQILSTVHTWPGASAVSSGAICIWKARQLRQARQPRRRQRSSSRYRIRIRRRRAGEKVRHGESWRLSEKYDRNKRRLEAQLIHRSDVFAHVVDAVAAAHSCGVTPEHIPREADARSPARRNAIFERRSRRASR